MRKRLPEHFELAKYLVPFSARTRLRVTETLVKRNDLFKHHIDEVGELVKAIRDDISNSAYSDGLTPEQAQGRLDKVWHTICKQKRFKSICGSQQSAICVIDEEDEKVTSNQMSVGPLLVFYV